MTSREKSWLATLVVLAVLGLVEWFYLPGHNQWLQALNNVGHMPVFGVLAVAMLHLVKVAAPGTRKKPMQAYGAAFAAAAALGAFSEALQYYGPRDASFEDLARDLVGAASFLALYAAVRDRDLREARAQSGRLRTWLLSLTAGLWLLGGWSFLAWSAAFAHRSLIFPVLCDFDSGLSTRFLNTYAATLERGVESDVTGMVTRGTRLHFESAKRPGVDVIDVSPDWTGHDSLVLELTVEADHGLRLDLSVFDEDDTERAEDRFSQAFAMDPGRHRIALALSRIRKGPVHRPLDMSQIVGVQIISDSTAAGQSVLLERLLLK